MSSAQITAWHKVVDPREAFLQFMEDSSVTHRYYKIAVHADTSIAIAAMRLYMDRVKNVELAETLIIESKDQGATWKLIGRMIFPGGKPTQAIVPNLHYLHDGTLIARETGGCLRYDRGSGTWTQIWQNFSGLFQGSDFTVAKHAAYDLIKVNWNTVLYVDALRDTVYAFKTDFEMGEATPNNVVFNHGERQKFGASSQDVRYNTHVNLLSRDVMWAPTLGLAIADGSIGDDDARLWDFNQFAPKFVTGAPVLVAQDGSLLRLTSPSKKMAQSNDYGRTWKETATPITYGNEVPISNRLGRKIFLMSSESYLLYASEAEVVPASLRWPADADTNRPDVQTLVCPAPLQGEIEVAIDDGPEFDSPLASVITTNRYFQVRDLAPRTKYYWRYRYRATPALEWIDWSLARTFTTGSTAYWKYLGKTTDSASLRFIYYRMLDGTYFKASQRSRTIFRSTDGAATWDSIAVLHVKPDAFFETAGGRLLVHGEEGWHHLNLDTRVFTTLDAGDWHYITGDDPKALYASHWGPRKAGRSTDDGNTWIQISELSEDVNGIVVDTDSSVLFGCEYWENVPGNGGTRSWIGGARRYYPKNNKWVQVAPRDLPYESDQNVTYASMYRDLDGLLYSVGRYGSTLKSSNDDGVTWQNYEVPILAGRDKNCPIWFDRDHRMIARFDSTEFMRRYDDHWEKIDDGISFRNAAYITLGSQPLTKLRDGGFVCVIESDAWIMMRDAHTAYMLPAQNTTLPQHSDVVFAWQPIAGADSYRLEVHSTPRTITTTQPSATVTGLTPGVHTWRVQAIVNGEARPWSAPARFVIDGPVSVQEEPASSVTSNPKPTMIGSAALRQIIASSPHDVILSDVRGSAITDLSSVALPATVILVSPIHRQLLLVVP